ncbi:MAG: Ig-like domain-containing protein, partial [Planctomycetota bacterium]|nr:Ig-like domain-containing protein [Planctomycetota bacterium]
LVVLLFDTPAGSQNAPPVASDLNVSGFEDQPITGQLPGFDPDGDPLTYSIVTGPVGGELQLDAQTGAFSYTPPIDFYGDVTFTYRVSDAVSSSPIAMVRLTFASVNDPPVVKPSQVTTNEDSVFDGRIDASDVDDAIPSFLLIDGPDHGTVVLNADGTFQFTPDADWNGTDSFTVSVSDGKAAPVLAVIPVHVAAVNDAPTVADATFTLLINAMNGAIVGKVAGKDIDGDVLSYAFVSGNDAAAFSIDAATGVIRVVDMAALRRLGAREVHLTVSVTDPSGETATATIVVKVETPSVKIRVGFKTAATVNLKGSPWVPLVVYSSDSFDVRHLNLGSLTFGRTGNEPSIKSFRRPIHVFRDVDGDGKLDLVLFVEVRKTGLSVKDSSVTLKGKLKNGQEFAATSAVTVINGKPKTVCKAKPAAIVKKK